MMETGRWGACVQRGQPPECGRNVDPGAPASKSSREAKESRLRNESPNCNNKKSFSYSASKIKPRCRPGLARGPVWFIPNAALCQMDKAWPLPLRNKMRRGDIAVNRSLQPRVVRPHLNQVL